MRLSYAIDKSVVLFIKTNPFTPTRPRKPRIFVAPLDAARTAQRAVYLAGAVSRCAPPIGALNLAFESTPLCAQDLTINKRVKRPWPWRLLVLGAGVVIGTLLLWWGLRPSMETPGSLKLLALKAANGDPKAIESLKDLGTNTVPTLAALLHYRDPFLRVQAWAIVPRLSKNLRQSVASKLRPLEASSLRVASAKALALLGPEAAGAVPELRAQLSDPEPYIAMQAASTLGAIGSASVPVLTNALKDPDARIRRAAVYGLGQAGVAAAPAFPQLIAGLSDSDPEVCSSSAYSISLVGYGQITALSNVIACAEMPQRQAAVRQLLQFDLLLGKLGPVANKMAGSSEAEPRRVALETFGFIRAAENRIVGALGPALDDPDVELNLEALKGLGTMNWHSQIVVAHLRKCLRAPTAQVREWAARDLGTAGPSAKPAVAELKAALQDKDPAVRAAVLEALDKIEPKNAPSTNNSASAVLTQ